MISRRPEAADRITGEERANVAEIGSVRLRASPPDASGMDELDLMNTPADKRYFFWLVAGL